MMKYITLPLWCITVCQSATFSFTLVRDFSKTCRQQSPKVHYHRGVVSLLGDVLLSSFGHLICSDCVLKDNYQVLSLLDK